jgi:anti-anti-sigma factor
MTPFRLAMHKASSEQFAVLDVHGELGLVEVESLEETLIEAASGKRGVAVGLESCDFIDSIGLAALVRTQTRFAENGQRFVVFGPTDQVRRILEVSGLHKSDFVFENADQALAGALG